MEEEEGRYKILLTYKFRILPISLPILLNVSTTLDSSDPSLP
jgi:hypothetical protein